MPAPFCHESVCTSIHDRQPARDRVDGGRPRSRYNSTLSLPGGLRGRNSGVDRGREIRDGCPGSRRFIPRFDRPGLSHPRTAEREERTEPSAESLRRLLANISVVVEVLIFLLLLPVVVGRSSLAAVFWDHIREGARTFECGRHDPVLPPACIYMSTW